jgi:prevent-host-death family protein
VAKRQRPTHSTKASEARQNWSKLLNEVHAGKSRVIIEKDGIPVAGLVSASDMERLELLEEERERNFTVLDEIRAAFADIPDDELEQEIANALAAVRAERRAAKHG